MRILRLAVATTALLLGRGMAEILSFNETTGLPVCAYDCKALWAAQFACAALPVGDQIKCFCEGELGWGGKTAWSGCDSVCEVEGRGKVAAWLGKTCGTEAQDGGGGGGGGGGSGDGGGNGGNGNRTSPRGPGGETGDFGVPGNSTVLDGGTGSAIDEAKKARAWWKKNYPFFVLAFLVITVPILIYAFAIPIRKWARRQIIRTRPRRQSNMGELGTSSYHFPGSPKPATLPGGSRHGSSTLALDGPSSSGVFTTQVLPPPPPLPPAATASTRQESWERRAREQFRKNNGVRLKFWKRKEVVNVV